MSHGFKKPTAYTDMIKIKHARKQAYLRHLRDVHSESFYSTRYAVGTVVDIGNMDIDVWPLPQEIWEMFVSK